MTADEFRRAVDVTFLGQVWGTMAALERMRPRDQGTIVNVGSALAFIGIPLQSAYCASKFACRGFYESVRAELLHDRSSIRMAMVHLPAVHTPQFGWCLTTLDRHPQPVPPIYDPADAGTRGIFADRSGGASDPAFLQSLPAAAVTFARAAVAAAGDARRWRRSRRQHGIQWSDNMLPTSRPGGE